ncbi:MAG: hypothetical protein JKX72_07020 [Robiginitomaculum sp.]|nr:hypothetical protein [Robiginitomaculum sp.]
MRILLIGLIFGISATANAGNVNTGHTNQSAPFTTENRVKVYRYGPTQAQKQADLNRYQHALSAQRQERQNKAARLQQQATQSAFERGFAQGRQARTQERQDTRRHSHSQRNRYGRRYTTGFFGSQFGSFNRPVQLGQLHRSPRH